jgi:hypothetical protein
VCVYRVWVWCMRAGLGMVGVPPPPSYNPDTYFFNGTQKNGPVKNIISNVVAALSADPTKRFVWAETVWLQMWYVCVLMRRVR